MSKISLLLVFLLALGLPASSVCPAIAQTTPTEDDDEEMDDDEDEDEMEADDDMDEDEMNGEEEEDTDDGDEDEDETDMDDEESDDDDVPVNGNPTTPVTLLARELARAFMKQSSQAESFEASTDPRRAMARLLTVDGSGGSAMAASAKSLVSDEALVAATAIGGGSPAAVLGLSPSAVPEPAACLLAVVAAVGLWTNWRGSKRRGPMA